MTVISDFPPQLRREASNDWNIAGNTATAGQTSGASVDTRSDGGGLWVVSLNDIQLWDQTDPKLWRATRQICNGGVVPINVFRLDQMAPFPSPGPIVPSPVTHSDGTTFSDGSGYHQPVIDVTCPAGSALRATTMQIKLNNCAALGGGEAFSILHPVWGWRHYEIGQAVPDSGDPTLVTITFNPPLRQRVEPGAYLEFDRPRCLMKLASSSAMNLNLTVLPYTRASVAFVEAKYSA